MKARRLNMLLIIAVILFCSGCSEKESVKTYPELEYGIVHDSDLMVYFGEMPYGTVVYACEEYEKPYVDKSKVAEQYLDTPDLQAAVKEAFQERPLNTDQAILTYAWELQPILQKYSYIPSDYIPTAARRYGNGVIEITYFGKSLLDHSFWERSHDEVMMFISENDGHIIEYISFIE